MLLQHGNFGYSNDRLKGEVEQSNDQANRFDLRIKLLILSHVNILAQKYIFESHFQFKQAVEVGRTDTHTQSEGKNCRIDLATQGHRRKQGLDFLNLYVYLNYLVLAFQKCVFASSE